MRGSCRACQQRTLDLIDPTRKAHTTVLARPRAVATPAVLQMPRSVYRHYGMHIDEIEERE